MPQSKQRARDAVGLAARELAVRVLLEVEERGAFADAVLARELARTTLSEADRGLATIIAYGTLARQLTLDAHIGARIDKSTDQLDAAVRVLLRSALFQLLFLDRVPSYAVVDSAVELAKRLAPKAGGLINAVLRRALREKLAAPQIKDNLKRAAFEFSHPGWLIEMWRNELGTDEADALMQANNEANPVVLRALVARSRALAALAAEGIEAGPARYGPDAIVARKSVEAPGIAIAQGESSQLVCVLAGVRAGDRVLDACAAPGGKTAYLAALAGPKGSVLAVDPTAHAPELIRATLERARCAEQEGAPVRIHHGSLTGLDPAQTGSFDVVLVDAPCTGLGTLRQHPEIRWRRSRADVGRLAAMQRELLAAAAAFVRPGGTLVYSTCTIARAENQDIVRGFLEHHTTFTMAEPSATPEIDPELFADDGSLRTLPHRHNTDGFYAVRMTRNALEAR